MDLIGARIEGDLVLSGASLSTSKISNHSNAYFEGVALSADRAVVSGALFMHEGFKSSGEIRIVNAKIGSDLICDGAKLTSSGKALSMWRTEIGGAVYFEDGFQSSGRISLSNAKIEGMISCSGMTLTMKDDLESTAFDLNGASIGDAVYLSDFETSGLVQMMGVHVRHDVEFRRAKLLAIGNALWLSNSEIGGNVLFHDSFNAFGTVNLHGASISGDLRFIGAKVGNAFCTNMLIEGDLAWLATRVLGQLSLKGTSLRRLRDDRSSWPSQGSLLLENLAYEDLILQKQPTAKEIEKGWYNQEIEHDLVRTEWLELQPQDRQLEPQPWRQLSKSLENKGNHRGAKRVIRAFQNVKAKRMRWPGRAMAYAFAWLEESPSRIAYSISLSLLLGYFVFSHAGATGALAPTDRDAYTAHMTGQPMSSAYPALNPFIYTLENDLPLVRLGQDDKWAPDRRHQAADWFTSYWFLIWVRGALILFGWFQATVLAAALATRFKP
jgi:hypothetical protein